MSKLAGANELSAVPNPTLRVVLDTCILKLATFPATDNAAALIFELSRARLIEIWASPAMMDEYGDVLSTHPDFIAEIADVCQLCHPLTQLRVIRHEPDNRFVECAVSAAADFIITVNTAHGHFDQKEYQTAHVVTPREFLKLDEVQGLLPKLAGKADPGN